MQIRLKLSILLLTSILSLGSQPVVLVENFLLDFLLVRPHEWLVLGSISVCMVVMSIYLEATDRVFECIQNALVYKNVSEQQKL